jgi:hypothetical protein
MDLKGQSQRERGGRANRRRWEKKMNEHERDYKRRRSTARRVRWRTPCAVNRGHRAVDVKDSESCCEASFSTFSSAAYSCVCYSINNTTNPCV